MHQAADTGSEQKIIRLADYGRRGAPTDNERPPPSPRPAAARAPAPPVSIDARAGVVPACRIGMPVPAAVRKSAAMAPHARRGGQSIRAPVSRHAVSAPVLSPVAFRFRSLLKSGTLEPNRAMPSAQAGLAQCR